MKVKSKQDPLDRQGTWDRAFGSGSTKKFNGPKITEHYEHKTLCRWLKDNYPDVRFYSTLDGFDFGLQRSVIAALRWHGDDPVFNGNGVPDLFIFKSSGIYSMLVLEIKKTGVRLGNSEHEQRQRDWLEYLAREVHASTHFSLGIEEGKKIITNYLQNGKLSKRRVQTVHNKNKVVDKKADKRSDDKRKKSR
jgi:hypothetical protein